MDHIERLVKETEGFAEKVGRPLVTLAYAQSLDGSIALRQDQQLHLSGNESQVFTHRLRAAHHAILVGVHTVLADDPKLNVRLVEGPNPQPVILDSYLSTPPGAQLLHGSRPAWIAAPQPVEPEKAGLLQAAGARILETKEDSQGRVDLADLLGQLFALGVRRLMVEGGGQVITSFLQQKLVDQLALTIAPIFVGGYPGYSPVKVEEKITPRLKLVEYIPLGEDVIVWGSLR
jgi:3,4-dihydroxy 2-butanone 4-phosphate synthase/GTP cyclohydrolase II